MTEQTSVDVCEGWWHPNVKSGKVHDHPERPGRNWSAASHRLCGQVWTKRPAPERASTAERFDPAHLADIRAAQAHVGVKEGREPIVVCQQDGYRIVDGVHVDLYTPSVHRSPGGVLTVPHELTTTFGVETPPKPTPEPTDWFSLRDCCLAVARCVDEFGAGEPSAQACGVYVDHLEAVLDRINGNTERSSTP